MAKLRKQFSAAEWDDCCTSLCGGCKIARAYIEKYGEKKAKKKMKKHQKKTLAGE